MRGFTHAARFSMRSHMQAKVKHGPASWSQAKGRKGQVNISTLSSSTQYSLHRHRECMDSSIIEESPLSIFPFTRMQDACLAEVKSGHDIPWTNHNSNSPTMEGGMPPNSSTCTTSLSFEYSFTGLSFRDYVTNTSYAGVNTYLFHV